MLFCDSEYYNALNIATPASPPNTAPSARAIDSWEAMLSLSRCAVVHDGWQLAAFFLPVDFRQEFVLGPHWGMKAPFIRVSYYFWKMKEPTCLSPGRAVAELQHDPDPDDKESCQWVLPLRIGHARLMFYGIAGREALAGDEADCAGKLLSCINFQIPDLSSD